MMKSNFIKKFLLTLTLTLTLSCGFTPMYSNEKFDVFVAPISGTNGIELRNALNAKFGISNDESAKYTLTVKLKQPQTFYKGLQLTGDATWQEIKLDADYTLKRNDDVILSGAESASASYTFVRFLVASNASKESAIPNIISVLSDKISMRVISVIRDQRPETRD